MSFHVVFMMGYLVVDAVYSKALLLEVDEEDGYSDSSSGGKAVNFFFSSSRKKTASGRGWPLTLPIDKIYGDGGPWDSLGRYLYTKIASVNT